MSNGEIIRSAPYQDLMVSCQEFQNLVKAHKNTIRISDLNKVLSHKAKGMSTKKKNDNHGNIYLESVKPSPANQLIKTEEREIGDTGQALYTLPAPEQRLLECLSLRYFLHSSPSWANITEFMDGSKCPES